MDNSTEENIEFSPILIMEFIRQVTVNRFLISEDIKDLAVRFKISKAHYDNMRAYPIQAQTIHLAYDYDEPNEVLSVKADDVVLEHFRSQKAQLEIAGKYEEQYKDRYKQFIEIID